MSGYEALLFRRGFLLTDGDCPPISDPLARAIVDGWQQVVLPGCRVRFDPVCMHGLAATSASAVLVLGLAFEPLTEIRGPQAVAEALLARVQRDEGEFIDCLDRLSGRFVVVHSEAGRTRVVPDACATRTVFYDFRSERLLVSSHATLIAAVQRYELSESAPRVMRLLSEHGVTVRYLPGVMSPYENVRALTANTLLDCESRSPIRIFPRHPPAGPRSAEDVVAEVAPLVKAQVAMAAGFAPLSMSLTAGLDSRVTLAAAREVASSIEYFTYLHRSPAPEQLVDLDVARGLCATFGLPHTTYRTDTADADREDFNAFSKIWLRNLGIPRGLARLNKAYLERFPGERIHLRSNLGEIVRAFYNSHREERISAAALATQYARPTWADEVREAPAILAAFEEFIDVTSFTHEALAGYDFYDLFYWEHRMSLWHSWLLLESDVIHDTFSIYNNRDLLARMLAVPYDVRRKNEFSLLLIESLWPGLLEIPINPKSYDRTAAVAKA